MKYVDGPIQFLRIQRLGKDSVIKHDPNIIYKALKHNLRLIKAELHPNSSSPINPRRSYLNKILKGKATPEEVVEYTEQLMRNANAKIIRKDMIRGIELVFSIPRNLDIDVDACFKDFVLWVESYFSGMPILSAISHFDEGSPHIHVIILPLIGDRLKGRDVMGGLSKIYEMRNSCQAAIGSKYGIVLQKKKEPNRKKDLLDASDAVDKLIASPSLLKNKEIKKGVEILKF